MDDLISRREAIDALNEVSEHYTEKGREWHPHVNFMIDAINDLPSAQRKGKWIPGKVKHIENGEIRNMRECSECGSCYFVYDTYNSVDEIPNFCPNCGALMEDGMPCDRYEEVMHEQETGEEEEARVGLSIHESSADYMEIPQTAYAETMENTGEMVNEDSTQVPPSSAPEPVRPLTPQEILLNALRDAAAESDRLFRIQKYKSMTNAAAMDAHAIEIGLVDPQNGGENGS